MSNPGDAKEKKKPDGVCNSPSSNDPKDRPAPGVHLHTGKLVGHPGPNPIPIPGPEQQLRTLLEIIQSGKCKILDDQPKMRGSGVVVTLQPLL